MNLYKKLIFIVVYFDCRNILPDGCKDLLLLFANDTAKFTHCVITNARPITVCKNCVHEYYQVLGRYENIQKVRIWERSMFNYDRDVTCFYKNIADVWLFVKSKVTKWRLSFLFIVSNYKNIVFSICTWIINTLELMYFRKCIN